MKKWMIVGWALFLVFAGAYLALAAGEKKAAPKSGEVDFWSSFRSLFVTPEPEYKDQVQRTTVSGVRGVDKEAKMTEKYDWNAVRAMEEFAVTEKQMFDFLQDGQVGPFFEKKGGGQ